MTLTQLLANTTSRELTEWQAYFRLENEKHEESKNKTAGKVTSKDPKMLSEAIKMQLAPMKAPTEG